MRRQIQRFYNWSVLCVAPNLHFLGTFTSAAQIDRPELGRLEGRVKRIYLDALLEDDIDLEETKYWFSTPEGMAHRLTWIIPRSMYMCSSPGYPMHGFCHAHAIICV